MFLAWEPLSVPGLAGDLAPVRRRSVPSRCSPSRELRVYCLGWTVVLAYLAVALPPLAARPLEIELTRAKVVAIAVAGTVALIVAVIGAPRAFLYFAF